jgi:hypothetical protein
MKKQLEDATNEYHKAQEDFISEVDRIIGWTEKKAKAEFERGFAEGIVEARDAFLSCNWKQKLDKKGT